MFVSIEHLAVLGLIGLFEGTLKAIPDSKPPRVDLKAICDKFLQTCDAHSLPHATWVVFKQVADTLRHRLCRWMEEQGLQYLWTLWYDSEVTSAMQSHSPKGDFWEVLHSRIQMHLFPKDHVGTTPKFRPRNIRKTSHQKGVVETLLSGMIDSAVFDSLLRNKIAILDDKKLVFVPLGAQTGDVVYGLPPGSESWLLRRLWLEGAALINPILLEHFAKLVDDEKRLQKPFRRGRSPSVFNGFLASLNTDSVEHFGFVGRCFGGSYDHARAYNIDIIGVKKEGKIMVLH
jgi:hypothetical protein